MPHDHVAAHAAAFFISQLSLLPLEHAAIGVNRLAGDIAGFGAAKKPNDRTNFFGFAQTAGKRCVETVMCGLAGRCAARINQPGSHTIDGDPVTGPGRKPARVSTRRGPPLRQSHARAWRRPCAQTARQY